MKTDRQTKDTRERQIDKKTEKKTDRQRERQKDRNNSVFFLDRLTFFEQTNLL